MDRFVSAELLNWGVIKVVATEEKADCLASFGKEHATEKLPDSFNGFGFSKNAALEIVHRESSVVVRAASKTDTWSMAGGPKTLARKLVDQLKKDYKKAN